MLSVFLLLLGIAESLSWGRMNSYPSSCQSSNTPFNNLQNFTAYTLNMAFISCIYRPRLPIQLSMGSEDNELRRHLGPTWHELRTTSSSPLPATPFATQYLTSFSESKLSWKNSLEKQKRHLGPTIDEIIEMKKEESSSKSGSTIHLFSNDPNGPSQVQ